MPVAPWQAAQVLYAPLAAAMASASGCGVFSQLASMASKPNASMACAMAFFVVEYPGTVMI